MSKPESRLCDKCGGITPIMRTISLGRHQDMLICNECWLAPFKNYAAAAAPKFRDLPDQLEIKVDDDELKRIHKKYTPLRCWLWASKRKAVEAVKWLGKGLN